MSADIKWLTEEEKMLKNCSCESETIMVKLWGKPDCRPATARCSEEPSSPLQRPTGGGCLASKSGSTCICVFFLACSDLLCKVKFSQLHCDTTTYSKCEVTEQFNA